MTNPNFWELIGTYQEQNPPVVTADLFLKLVDVFLGLGLLPGKICDQLELGPFFGLVRFLGEID